jgi:hypothetical protein
MDERPWTRHFPDTYLDETRTFDGSGGTERIGQRFRGVCAAKSNAGLRRQCLKIGAVRRLRQVRPARASSPRQDGQAS